MQCLVCRSSSRPVKFQSKRVSICQWCVTLLCQSPIDPDQLKASFFERVDSFAIGFNRVRDKADFLSDARRMLGHPARAGVFESIFNRSALVKREAEALALADKMHAEHATTREELKRQTRDRLAKRVLARDSQMKVLTGSLGGSFKSEDLVPATMVKYVNAIDLQLLSGSSKATRPDQQDWENLRQEVLAQDSYRCRLCNAYPNEKHIHHIIPLSKFGSNHPNNLITLCHKCHSSVHPDIEVTTHIGHSRRVKGK